MKPTATTVAVILLAFAAAAGCSKAKPKGAECSRNDDCGAGRVCVDSTCLLVCGVQTDCPAGRLCVAQLCVNPRQGDLPSIASVSGNGADTAHIDDGLLVTGTILANATFELRATGASPSIALTVRTQSDTAAELVFPADIRAGVYALVATNQSGSGEAPVQLTLPDFTGDLAIERINAATTSGRIAIGRIDLASAGLDAKFVDSTGDAMTGDLAVAGLLGVARASPAARLEVGAGYTYVKASGSSSQGTPRCECDQSATLADCGDPATVTAIQEWTHYPSGHCFDHWDIAGLGATDFQLQAGEPPLPGMVVTQEGRVGIRTTTPLVALDVTGVANSAFEGFSYIATGFAKLSGWSAVTCATREFNTFGDSTYDVSTGTFTAPKAGYYRFSIGGYVQTAATLPDDHFAVAFVKNATFNRFCGAQLSTPDTPVPGCSGVIALAAGDTVSLASYTTIAATFGSAGVGHFFWFQGEFAGK